MNRCCTSRCIPRCRCPFPDCCMADQVKEFIRAELCDSRYFFVLASMAPTKLSQDVLIQLSMEDQMLAQTFLRALTYLTCKEYCLPEVCDPVIADFCEGLKRCLLDETTDSRVYGEKYLESVSPALRDMFFRAMLTETQHATLLSLCLCEGGCCGLAQPRGTAPEIGSGTTNPVLPWGIGPYPNYPPVQGGTYPNMTPNLGAGTYPGMTPNMGTGAFPGMTPNMGTGAFPGMSPNMGTGTFPGMTPNLGTGTLPNTTPNMGTGGVSSASPSMGTTPTTPTTPNGGSSVPKTLPDVY